MKDYLDKNFPYQKLTKQKLIDILEENKIKNIPSIYSKKNVILEFYKENFYDRIDEFVSEKEIKNEIKEEIKNEIKNDLKDEIETNAKDELKRSMDIKNKEIERERNELKRIDLKVKSPVKKRSSRRSSISSENIYTKQLSVLKSNEPSVLKSYEPSILQPKHEDLITNRDQIEDEPLKEKTKSPRKRQSILSVSKENILKSPNKSLDIKNEHEKSFISKRKSIPFFPIKEKKKMPFMVKLAISIFCMFLIILFLGYLFEGK